MAFKVLCLALVACSTVQAAPEFSFGNVFSPSKWVRDGGQAIVQTRDENTGILYNMFNKAVDVAEDAYDAGKASAKFGVSVLTSPVQYTQKVINAKGSILDRNTWHEKFVAPLQETVNENVDLLRDKIDAIGQAAETAANAAVEIGSGKLKILKTPLRIAAIVGKDTPVVDGNDLSGRFIKPVQYNIHENVDRLHDNMNTIGEDDESNYEAIIKFTRDKNPPPRFEQL